MEEVLLGIQWDAPFYYQSGMKFIPLVWEGEIEQIPAGFNSIQIQLDGRVQSELTWNQAIEEARKAVSEGYSILWKMELGLFDDLPHPLGHQSQFLSLNLSIDHFKDTVWQEFKENTLGISLYQGEADFNAAFPWDEAQVQNFRKWLIPVFKDEETMRQETGISCPSFAVLQVDEFKKSAEGRQLLQLYCHDVAMEYAGLLAARLPDGVPAYLFLDGSNLTPRPIDLLQHLHPEKFEFVRLGLFGSSFPFPAWGWNQPSSWGYLGEKLPVASLDSSEPKVALCLPPPGCYRQSHWQGIDRALTVLEEYAIPYKIIGEGQLLTNWDGLDHIIYSPVALTPQGRRQLMGFCAADGTIVSLGELLGFPHEVSFDQWISK